jgi:MSHA biogenesis protein MshP
MLLALVFFMVVGGVIAAAVLGIARFQAGGAALDVQGVRAYWAARSAIEWAAYKVLDPDDALALPPDQLPGCFDSPHTLALPGDLAVFTVTVSCERHPATGSHEEQQNRVVGYLLTATASSGAPGAADRVERRIESRVIKCKSPLGGTAPDYAC